jgi:hypothetical protein
MYGTLEEDLKVNDSREEGWIAEVEDAEPEPEAMVVERT